jgi:hypothetical protein
MPPLFLSHEFSNQTHEMEDFTSTWTTEEAL